MSKKDKHARNQAKYMERKREAGLEWLSEWVPKPAFPAFRMIAKAARKSQVAPTEARLATAAAIADRHGVEFPDWARASDMLVTLWEVSVVAGEALDHIHGERDAAKAKKAEAKAADVANEANEAHTTGEAAADQDTPAPAPRRARKRKPAPEDSATV